MSFDYMEPTVEHPVQPDPIDLVHQLREALGWPVVAMAVSPKEAWEQALWGVRRLRRRIALLESSSPEEFIRRTRSDGHE